MRQNLQFINNKIFILMKKLLFTLFAVTCISVVAMANGPRSIGLHNGEVNYQHSLGESNMIQLDLGWSVAGIGATATYDWIKPISSWNLYGSWNWYYGVGANLGTGYLFNYFTVGAAGRIGVEYQFEFPMKLFTDFRPTLGPTISSSGLGFNWAGLYSFGAGIAYVF